MNRPETKIVIVVREGLAPNLAANATAVLGLGLGARVPHLLGADGRDASGGTHAGLVVVPVPVLVAAGELLPDLHARARERDEVTAVGFTSTAQVARDYAGYLRDLTEVPAAELDYLAVGLHGPRNRITALTKRFALLGAQPDSEASRRAASVA